MQRRSSLRAISALALAFVGCSHGVSGPCCGGAAAPLGDAAPGPPSPPPSKPGSAGFCVACAAPVTWGALVNPEIREASGIAPSSVHPDVFYVHNDHGDTARFFAIDRSGADLGTFEVEGAVNVDWEDIARGPCPTGSCLYIADTGDNKQSRSDYVIYRVPEPSSLGPGRHTVKAEAFPFTYPDGSYNAETLLVHPTTGALTIVTKVAKKKKHRLAASVFELPQPLVAGRMAAAVKIDEIEVPEESPRLTGGSVHPQGTGVLLRNHTNVFYYPMTAGQPVASALAGAACVFPPDAEKGEAITWLPSGAGFVTVSEGVGAAVRFVGCPQ